MKGCMFVKSNRVCHLAFQFSSENGTAIYQDFLVRDIWRLELVSKVESQLNCCFDFLHLVYVLGASDLTIQFPSKGWAVGFWVCGLVLFHPVSHINNFLFRAPSMLLIRLVWLSFSGCLSSPGASQLNYYSFSALESRRQSQRFYASCSIPAPALFCFTMGKFVVPYSVEPPYQEKD
ncbi:hypothetical protein CLF_107765, partial [Clonorchis sinensis]